MADDRNDDEPELVAAWLTGDRQAGFRLFQRHYDAVARFFHHKVPEHSADLIQRTFLGCVESLPRFRGHASFRSYLFAIAYRQLCRHFRDHGRERARLDFTSVSIADLRPSPSAAIGAASSSEPSPGTRRSCSAVEGVRGTTSLRCARRG